MGQRVRLQLKGTAELLHMLCAVVEDPAWTHKGHEATFERPLLSPEPTHERSCRHTTRVQACLLQLRSRFHVDGMHNTSKNAGTVPFQDAANVPRH